MVNLRSQGQFKVTRSIHNSHNGQSNMFDMFGINIRKPKTVPIEIPIGEKIAIPVSCELVAGEIVLLREEHIIFYWIQIVGHFFNWLKTNFGSKWILFVSQRIEHPLLETGGRFLRGRIHCIKKALIETIVPRSKRPTNEYEKKHE